MTKNANEIMERLKNGETIEFYHHTEEEFIYTASQKQIDQVFISWYHSVDGYRKSVYTPEKTRNFFEDGIWVEIDANYKISLAINRFVLGGCQNFDMLVQSVGKEKADQIVKLFAN